MREQAPLLYALLPASAAAGSWPGARVAAMQTTNSPVNSRSLTSVERKNIHVGSYPGWPVVNAWSHPATVFAYAGSPNQLAVFVTT